MLVNWVDDSEVVDVFLLYRWPENGRHITGEAVRLPICRMLHVGKLRAAASAPDERLKRRLSEQSGARLLETTCAVITVCMETRRHRLLFG